MFDSTYYMGKFCDAIDRLPMELSDATKMTLLNLAGSINTSSYREGYDTAARYYSRVKGDNNAEDI